MARHYSYATILHLYLSVTSSPKEEGREKRLSSGRGEGRLFGTEPELKVNRNYTVRPQTSCPVKVNQSTQGQGSARWPPACVYNTIHIEDERCTIIV